VWISDTRESYDTVAEGRVRPVPRVLRPGGTLMVGFNLGTGETWKTEATAATR
jgi:hypothetical protein